MTSTRTRSHYQEGSIARVTRAKGPDVWVYRWRELQMDGRRAQRKQVIGDVERYPTSDAYDLVRRTLDFTSKATTQLPGITPGQAATGGDLLFMDFIDHSVKPLIESELKIDSSRQTLLGHSLGGLFTLETMISHPGSFQTYVAISPSIWWNSNALLGQMQHFLKSTRRPAELRVFLSVGMLEQYMTPDYVARTRFFNRDPSKPGAVTDDEADKDNREMRAKTNGHQCSALGHNTCGRPRSD